MNPENPPIASAPIPTTPKGLQYFAGFSLFYRDPNFLNNLLIGSLFLIIPIIGPIVLQGWYCEIIQRLVRRHPKPVPKLDFSDFGDYLGRGVVPFLANFIVSIPMVIILYALIFLFVLLMAAMSKSGLGEGPLLIFGSIGGLALFLAIMLPFMVLSFSVMTFAQLTEDFGQTFNFSRLFAYAKRNWREILLAMLVLMPISFGMMILGMVACVIGMYPAILFVQFAMLHLQWQVYENDVARGGTPLPIKPERILSSEKPSTVSTPPPSPTPAS